MPTLFDPPPSKKAMTGIRVNPSVTEAQKAHLKAQAVAIYKRLLTGPVTTGELVEMAAQYNARIKELREWLCDYGLTVDKIGSATQANNRYAIRSLTGSRYQALQMRKSARRGRAN